MMKVSPLIVCCALVGVTHAIDCYQCNSVSDSGCDEMASEEFRKSCAGICMIIKSSAYGMTAYQRHCLPTGYSTSMMPERCGTIYMGDMQVKSCNCGSDDCNQSWDNMAHLPDITKFIQRLMGQGPPAP